MRVAVTGGTGNVGTSVMAALDRVREVDSTVALARRAPDSGFGHEFAQADVTSDHLAQHFRGAEVVVHLAWAIQPSRDEAATRATNVDGTRRVLEAVAEAGVGTLVYASSVGAYSPGPADLRFVDEEWPTDGIETSFYSRHKAEVERMLDTFELEHPDVRVVRLRPALIFKAGAGAEIRRLFAGPLLPSPLVAPSRLPVFPWVSGLSTQAVHTDDVAQAYALAVVSDVEGAFNIAAEPVLNATTIGEALGKRVIEVPAAPVRAACAVSWRARLQPTPEGWFDMGMKSPLMSSARAEAELGWEAKRSATGTLAELLQGIADASGESTPPLAHDAGGALRSREIATGIGGRDDAATTD